MSDPAQTVINLLKYPDAYWQIHYIPHSIGRPKYVIGAKRVFGQFIHVSLFLIAAIIGLIGSYSLWGVIAYDVWHQPQLGRIVSILTIILSAIVAVLGWASPFYHDRPQTYKHVGLGTVLSSLDRKRLLIAHMKIYLAAKRMDLISAERIAEAESSAA